MAVQDDYILRTIRNLATAIGRLALGRDEVDYILPADESQDDLVAAKYRRIRSMAEAGQINEAVCITSDCHQAENLLFDEVMDTEPSYLEMGLSFYLYLNEFDDDFLYSSGYSREEIVDGINAIAREFGISGFENFVDTTMV